MPIDAESKACKSKRPWLFLILLYLLPLALIQSSILHAQIQPSSPRNQPSPHAERFGGTYRRPLDNAPGTLDPARINDIYARTISQQIYDGLVQYDESLGIRPAIAQSWKSSRDGRIWTFNLREGVKFHHGREVIAEDFVYSFTRLLDPKMQSAAAQFFVALEGAQDFIDGKAKSVKGLQAVGRHILQIKLAHASSPFVPLLAIGYAKVVPRELIDSPGNNFDLRPVGTGPFRVVRLGRDKEVVLEANPDYFDGRPYLDRIEYKIFPGAVHAKMFLQFENRDLEDAPVPAKMRPFLREDNRYQFVRRPMMGIRFLAFNTSWEALKDRRIRQALNHAVDQVRISREIYQEKYSPAGGILPPGTYSYDPKLVAYPYDPERARQLLVEAGYPEGKGIPKLIIWSSVKFEEATKELESIVQDLSAIGITTEVQYNTDWPTFKRDVYEGKLPIFRYSWYGMTPDPENFLYRLFHSQSVDNFTRLHSPRIDSLLTRASAEPNQIRRVNHFREAEREILNEAPILLLGYYSYERVFQAYVKGIKVSPFGDPYIPMKDIWLDKAARTHGDR